MKAKTSADSIGDRFDTDPELTLPTRPRLITELVVLPLSESGLLFEGTRNIEVLTGRSARSDVPQLLQLMDGTRQLEEIAESFPRLTVRQVRSVTALLYSRGLLEDGVPAPVSPALSDVDSLLGRWIDITRLNRNRGEAWARLRAHHVVIAGASRHAAFLRDQLRSAGVGEVNVADETPDTLADISLLISIDDGDEDRSAKWISAAMERGIRSLHARLATDAVEIGPLFVPKKSACYDCFRYVAPPTPSGIRPDNHDQLFWLSMIALHAFHLLSEIADMRLFNSVKRYESGPDGVGMAAQSIARMPGCSRCGIEGPQLARSSAAAHAWLLHNSIGLPPRSLLAPRAHQIHYTAANVALTGKPIEPYHGAETVAIAPTILTAAAPWTASYSAERPSTVTLEHLSTLLKFSAGHNGTATPASRRIAPTGGGLGSPHLFVVANRVAGLARGVYHYDGTRDLLERVRDEPSRALEAALHVKELGACTIVGTADLQRVQGKYGGFAYRIIHLDAGISLGYLHLIAETLGLAVTEHADFHDNGLAPHIGFPTVDNRYVPTFAISLEDAQASDNSDRVPLGWSLTASVLRGSVLPKDRQTNNDRPLFQLISASPDSGSFEDVILRRRSVRRFSRSAPSAEALRRIMTAAAALCETRRRSGGPPVHVEPWLALRTDAEKLEAGIYRMSKSASPQLTLHRRGCSADNLVDSVLQRSLAAAPAVVFLCGHFPRAFAERGSRGYRELLVQSGVAAAQVLLSATADHVASCPSGGLMEDGFRATTGTDGFGVSPMLAISLGYPEANS